MENLILDKDFADLMKGFSKNSKNLGDLENALSYFESAKPVYYAIMNDEQEQEYQYLDTVLEICDIHIKIGNNKEAFDCISGVYDRLFNLKEFIMLNEAFFFISTVDTMGAIHRSSGNYEEAIKYFQIALGISHLATENHSLEINIRFFYAKAIALKNLGDSLFQLGQPIEAETLIKQSISILEDLAINYSDDEEYINNLFEVYYYIVKWLLIYKNYDDCFIYISKQYKLTKKINFYGTIEISRISKLALFYKQCGEYFFNVKDYMRAGKYHKKELVNRELLVKLSKDDISYKYGLALCHKNLGIVFQTMKKMSRSKKYYYYYKDIIEILCKYNPDRVDFQNELSICYTKIAYFFKDLKANKQHFYYLYKALKLSKSISKLGNVLINKSLAILYYSLAYSYQEIERFDKSLKYILKSNKVYSKLCNIDAKNFDFLKGKEDSLDMIISNLINLDFFASGGFEYLHQSLSVSRDGSEKLSLYCNTIIDYFEKLSGNFELLGLESRIETLESFCNEFILSEKYCPINETGLDILKTLNYLHKFVKDYLKDEIQSGINIKINLRKFYLSLDKIIDIQWIIYTIIKDDDSLFEYFDNYFVITNDLKQLGVMQSAYRCICKAEERILNVIEALANINVHNFNIYKLKYKIEIEKHNIEQYLQP